MKALYFAALLAATVGTSATRANDPVNLVRMTMGYTYYSRPSATIDVHNAEVRACAAESDKTRSMEEVTSPRGGLLSDALTAGSHHGAVGAALENCMVVRGWRVVRLGATEGEALAALPQDALTAKLAPWVGAVSPYGAVVRVWGNDAARGSTTRYANTVDHINEGQLSLKAATGGTLKQYRLADRAAPEKVVLDPKWPTTALKPGEFASAPSGSAILVVGVRNASIKNGAGVVFERQGPDPTVRPSSLDRAPDRVYGAVRALFAKDEVRFVAVAVPPGRWRIATIGVLHSISLCLGSPAFEVKAGDVVYTGAFDMAGEEIGPDLTLAPAQAYLAGQPAAQTVRVAIYLNGTRGVCGGNTIYAFEIQGAPFDPDYTWGGAARTAAPPATKP
jgi:hypothetical protein